MIVPAIQKIKDMPGKEQMLFRNLFRRIVADGIIKQNLGLEASEECLQGLYDKGWIKISLEPSTNPSFLGRIMLYQKDIDAYRIADEIELMSQIK